MQVAGRGMVGVNLPQGPSEAGGFYTAQQVLQRWYSSVRDREAQALGGFICDKQIR